MSKRMVMLLVTVLTMTGCMGEAFYVDSRFTESERKDIQAAADSWSAVGAEPINFVWRQKISEFETGRKVIVRPSGERAASQVWDGFCNGAHSGVHLKGFNDERIVIVPELIPPGAFRTVVAHEFGHHYGVPHLLDPHALMYHDAGAESPTELDVQALVLAGQP